MYPPEDHGGPAETGPEQEPRRRRRAGIAGTAVIVALSLLLAGILKGHRFIPNAGFNVGSLVETFLPWFGLAVPILLVWAVWRRSIVSIAAVLIPAVVWAFMFGGLIPDKSTGEGDFSIVTHNVKAGNTDVRSTADSLAASEADVIVGVELTPEKRAVYDEVLGEGYPNAVDYGTVGLWSKYPVSASEPVDLGIGWTRAFRAQIDIEGEPVAVYVAHLLSVRVNTEGFTIEQRDETARLLGNAIADEQLDRVVLAGDLNGTMQDSALAPITYQLRSAHAAAGKGFGFTWPEYFPAARIDQILFRGLTATDSAVLGETGSDHLPIRANFSF
ncbi:endonuclease/exonuclease/phosphatase family protein [Salininema proteolyticum]|uniref:Endonuclease/exonuclease/phosphatase family protein n=1 Tax=Salininema proteolyticum TaxID=1607685 RepID=A0ABV8TWY6_9ACTN